MSEALRRQRDEHACREPQAKQQIALHPYSVFARPDQKYRCDMIGIFTAWWCKKATAMWGG